MFDNFFNAVSGRSLGGGLLSNDYEYPDVDNMSQEELLRLQERIGYGRQI